MSEKPLIGLITYGMKDSGKFSLPFEYVRSVRQAGGIPVMLPSGDTHPVQVVSGSKLHKIVQVSSLEIVSWHHQAVKDIPGELIITAKSEGGVVEGLELDSHPWLVAVQWHPELSADKDEKQHLLFRALVDAAAIS